jgi:hypothetical protein
MALLTLAGDDAGGGDETQHGINAAATEARVSRLTFFWSI